MSNRGNHGDGDPQNTETPICAWGAGITKSSNKIHGNHDAASIAWNMSHIERKDLNQADIAPLMVFKSTYN